MNFKIKNGIRTLKVKSLCTPFEQKLTDLSHAQEAVCFRVALQPEGRVQGLRQEPADDARQFQPAAGPVAGEQQILRQVQIAGFGRALSNQAQGGRTDPDRLRHSFQN